MIFKFNKSSGLPRRNSAEAGQVSKLLLVLAVIVLVAVIIVYLVMKMAEKPAAPVEKKVVQVAPLVFETQLGNIRFVFESGIDRGNALLPADIKNSQYNFGQQKGLTTTEKFVQVTIGAQNKGTVNTEHGAWDIENIVDSQGRNFIPLQGYTVDPWLPNPNLCGSLLKPAFDPVPCTKIYEVSKESTGLKIRVRTGKDNAANNLSSGKVDELLLDLIVK